MNRLLLRCTGVLFWCPILAWSQVSTAYVDFGAGGQQTASPDANGRRWNNVIDTQPVAALGNLLTDTGDSTGIGLSVAGFLSGANTSGTTVPDASALGGLAVPSATMDSFYVAGSDVLTVTLSNLPTDGIFRISLFGSRDTTETRITRYDISGLQTSSSQTLKASGQAINTSSQPNANRSGLAVFENVRPTTDGVITISVRRDTGSYGYLNALRLETMNVVNFPPAASNAGVVGALRVGGAVTPVYTYADQDGDAEGDTQFIWERTTNPSGGTVVRLSGPSASERAHTLTAADQGAYLRVGVVPRAATGRTQGTVTYSGWVGTIHTAESMSTFHIGNSFTRWSNIPQELTNLVQATGGDLAAGYQMTDAQTLHFHWDTGLGGFYTGTPSRADLPTGTWDALVIQPHSREWQSYAMGDFQTYAQRFYDIADAAGTQVYLYAYWPYSSESVSTQNAINASFEQIRTNISRGGRKPALIIPAGEALRAVASQLGTGVLSGYNRDSLYLDERHPSDMGAYISALTHYATLFKKSPVGLPAKGISADFPTDVPVNFPPEVATKLQQIVWSVVTTYPNSGVTAPLTPVTPPSPPVYVHHDPASTDPALVAYAFGPAGADGNAPVANLPRCTRGAGGTQVLECTLNADAEAQGVTYAVEWSTDLVNWTNQLPTGTVVERTGQKWRVTMPASGWATRRFLRVYVQLADS
ncbi:hypothetical protein KBB96_15255 [Luteolibacter ambystomatis]|uniref:SGNH/GDSL hydrolase family protein n=1 Tax=Luteolibacter ambystomatis TaxID=2824561 RepID=A0A975IYB6_9BACT|nr:hypothetical protein [Luteolibacter ambystomatis]QUE50221.1 hypothetical protein KBB96_15255 [Luteolibacter ambystomatis]